MQIVDNRLKASLGFSRYFDLEVIKKLKVEGHLKLIEFG